MSRKRFHRIVIALKVRKWRERRFQWNRFNETEDSTDMSSEDESARLERAGKPRLKVLVAVCFDRGRCDVSSPSATRAVLDVLAASEKEGGCFAAVSLRCRKDFRRHDQYELGQGQCNEGTATGLESESLTAPAPGDNKCGKVVGQTRTYTRTVHATLVKSKRASPKGHTVSYPLR